MSIQPSPVDELRSRIAADLYLTAFPLRGYREEEYLRRALDAGYSVAELARAHDVSERSIYRAIENHSINLQKPPSNGPARTLWNTDPDDFSTDT
jgi:hypothetical protein